MKTYEKLIANPLGLATCTIRTDTFTDEKLTDKDNTIIKLALKSKMIKEIDAKEESQNTAIKADDEVTRLTAELEKVKGERDDVVLESFDLKKELVDGWDEMTAENLAKDFTIPELKFIADNLCKKEVDYKSNIKEKALSEKIVEANEIVE